MVRPRAAGKLLRTANARRMIDLYESTVTDNTFPTSCRRSTAITPTCAGSRSEDGEAGLRVVAQGPLEFSASHFTAQDLYAALSHLRSEAAAGNVPEPRLSPARARHGLSCGPDTLERYRIEPGRIHRLAFELKPFVSRYASESVPAATSAGNRRRRRCALSGWREDVATAGRSVLQLAGFCLTARKSDLAAPSSGFSSSAAGDGQRCRLPSWCRRGRICLERLEDALVQDLSAAGRRACRDRCSWRWAA